MVPKIRTTLDTEAIERARARNHVPWCDDFELMISGNMYRAFVQPLVDARLAARGWMHEYNNTNSEYDNPSLQAKRMDMLRAKLGRVGDDAFIEPNFMVDYGCNISVGTGFYANFKCVFFCPGPFS